jgi:uncharacterized membrane protein YgdD (TMEM256/DUF423 family)
MMSSPSLPARRALGAAGLLGLSGVALGALGAHALKGTLAARGMDTVWSTAAQYHLGHALALAALAAWLRGDPTPTPSLAWVTRCWTAGTVLFSGSLYVLALGGPRWLGPVTPIGGVALLAGWLLLSLAALRGRRTE